MGRQRNTAISIPNLSQRYSNGTVGAGFCNKFK